jgi:hypothetical protein
MLRHTMIAMAVSGALCAPTFAAQDSKNPPGQSEYAPGQRAKDSTTKDAKDFAPGQRMQNKDDASKPGASEYAPGKQGKYDHQK